tara:strand:+ start:95 stop:343 length:249 start_codon:yes stop_codon:yes gene_type:complete
MAKRYDIEIPSVVERTVVHEEIIFKGKKIIRERIVKKIKLPKIITNDYSYEMLMGFKPGLPRYGNKTTGIESVSVNINNHSI